MSRQRSKGELIRQRRRELGLTQKQLAERVQVDPSAISNIERGRIGLGHTRALRFSEALGLSPELLDGERLATPTMGELLDRLEELAEQAASDRREALELRAHLLVALQRLEAVVAELVARLGRPETGKSRR